MFNNNNNSNANYSYNNSNYSSNNNNYNNKDSQNHTPNNISQDPRLKNISPIKLKIIREIAEKSKGRSIEEMLPQIMQVNKELQARNISFTKDETALLLDVIEETLPPKDKARFNMLKGFIQ